jgi:AcrR family transcriptional regulator
MNGETATKTAAKRRMTRAEQRVATRSSIIEATIACLVEEGWPALTTRNVADRAGIAQSTLMHHFETREALMVESVTYLALRLADDALDQIDLAELRSPAGRDAVLDQAWREFTSPQALAAGQLWAAAWTEPELAATLRELEERLTGIIYATAATLFPEVIDDTRFGAVLDAAVSLIRGLVLAIPVSGREAVDVRWEAIKPILSQAAADLLDQA